MYVMELEPDMLTVKNDPKQILKSNMIDGRKCHGFFEASSMRKINGKYYFIYSSNNSHELCYMTSDHPDRDFVYGGTLVSIGDVFYQGRPLEHTMNHLGNTHGSLEKVNDQWYIFYHRQTNRHNYSRQACAEPVTILPDGSIPQAEITSCGLNGGPLEGKGVYPAYIACNLFVEGHAGYTGEADYEHDSRPYLTQDGGDREDGENQYITGWKDRGVLGYKYFRYENTKKIGLWIKGDAQGSIDIALALDETDRPVSIAAIPVDTGKLAFAEDGYAYVETEVSIPEQISALYFAWHGTGSLTLKQFRLD